MTIWITLVCSWVALVQATAPETVRIAVEGQSPKSAFEASEVVFAGYLVEQCTRFEGEAASRDHQIQTSKFVGTCEFEVVAVWRGEVGRPLLCFPAAGIFRLGELYLVYAEEHNGMLERGPRTREWSEALVDLYQLPKPLDVVPPFEMPTVTVESLIETVIDGYEVNWLVHDFRWLTQDAGRIVPVFTSVLRSQAPGDTEVAMEILGYMGPASQSAIPDLERIAKNGSERLRGDAFSALDRIETSDRERVRRINECLSDSSSYIRSRGVGQAAQILGGNKPFAERRSLIAKLEAVSQSDSDERVRESASRVLENLNDEH